MSNQIKNRLSWAYAVTKGFRWNLVLYMLLDTISTILMLYFVYCSKQAIDIALQVIPGNLRLELIHLALSIVISVMMSLASMWISEYVKNEMTIRLQKNLAHSQIMVTWKGINQFYSGDLMVRLDTDCVEVVHTLVYIIPSFILIGIRLAAAFLLLWTFDPSLAKIILAFTPLFILSRIFYRRMRRITKETKDAESRLGNILQENIEYRSLIQALSITEVREKKYTDTQQLLLRKKIQQLNLATLRQGILRFIYNGGYLLTFLWGIYRLHYGYISYGTMAAYLQLIGRVQVPVISMMSVISAVVRFRTAIERLMELNDGEREVYANPVKLKSPLTLKIHQLSYRYNEKDVINNFNMECRTGISTAITGASGKGKTTLIRLILAVIKPDSGSMTLTQEDSGEIHEITVDTRNNMAYVPQGNTMFTGTIRENLIVAYTMASDEHIHEVLRIACAEFVYSLPKGLDTVIGELGIGISEGQAQRLAVARTLLREDSSIWLFDEFTSALDMDTIHRIFRNILIAAKDKMLIFVTHDNYIIDRCSQVVKLD